MAVRNLRELSRILKKVTERLLANQTLCKLVYYNDQDPISKADFVSTSNLLGKEIRFIPKVGPQENTKSKVVLVWSEGEKNPTNSDIVDLSLKVYVYTPFSEWIILGDELRIFYIMAEIEETLDGKEVNGLGRLKSSGFYLDIITDELAAYRMEFTIDVFS